MGEETIGSIVASFGAGELDVEEFMQAVQEEVNILYPTSDLESGVR